LLATYGGKELAHRNRHPRSDTQALAESATLVYKPPEDVQKVEIKHRLGANFAGKCANAVQQTAVRTLLGLSKRKL
jgi:hypothetical protein